MTFGPGFNVARESAASFGQAKRANEDRDAIEQILLSASKNQGVDPMSQILSRVRDPEMQQQAILGLQSQQQQRQLQQQQAQLLREREAQRKLGLDPDLPLDIKKEQFKQMTGSSTSEGEKKFQEGRGKAVSDYTTEKLAQGAAANELDLSIQNTKRILKGDITGPGTTAMLKKNAFLAPFFGLTPDEAELQAETKRMLEGTKGIFGSKPTEREIFLLLDQMLPSLGKTQEANLAGLEAIERINNLKMLSADLVDQLTEGGSKYVPNIEAKVAKELKPYVQELREFMIAETEKQDQMNKAKEKNKKMSPSDQLIEQARASRKK